MIREVRYEAILSICGGWKVPHRKIFLIYYKVEEG